MHLLSQHQILNDNMIKEIGGFPWVNTFECVACLITGNIMIIACLAGSLLRFIILLQLIKVGKLLLKWNATGCNVT